MTLKYYHFSTTHHCLKISQIYNYNTIDQCKHKNVSIIYLLYMLYSNTIPKFQLKTIYTKTHQIYVKLNTFKLNK